MEYTWVDFIIFGVIFLNTITGLARGPIKEIVSTLVLIVALIVTIKFTVPIANLLNNTEGFADVVDVFARFLHYNAAQPLSLLSWGIAMLLLFAGTFCIGETVNYYSSISVMVFPIANILARIIGGILGFVRGYAFSLIVILTLGLTPIVTLNAWSQSVMIQKLAPAAANLGNHIRPGGFPVWSGR